MAPVTPPTFEGPPVDRRAALLATVAGLVRADLYALFDVRRGDHGLCYDVLTVTGDDTAVDFWRRGVPGSPWVGPWDPKRPGQRWANSFSSGLDGELAVRRERGELEGWNHFYDPIGLRFQRRTLVYDGEVFAGWLGLIRYADNTDFSRADDRVLAQARPEIASWVCAEAKLRDDATPSRACVLARENGTVEFASRDVSPWLDGHRAALATWTRRAAAGEAPASVVIGGSVLRWVPMVGPGGARNFLWTLDAAARPQRSGLPLSPRQHDVAELAACGATAPEIARELGIGPHTVRQHLKVVYRELEVGNRIELAERLAEEDK